jgi:surfactin synthase thioesterase subunit
MLSSWLVPAGAVKSPQMNLFCFPYAGGGASLFRSWPKILDQSIQLFGVQAPGKESRFSEAPLLTVADYADQAAKVILQTTGATPLALFGHSLGAAVAYETACRLSQAGKDVSCLLVSGRQAPNLKSKMKPISHQSDSQFISELALLEGTPTDVLANTELLELLLPMVKSEFAMSEAYRGSSTQMLACPVLAMGSTEDIWLDDNSLNLWSYVTSGQFQTKWFGGDHFFLRSHQADLVSFISDQLLRLRLTHPVQ